MNSQSAPNVTPIAARQAASAAPTPAESPSANRLEQSLEKLGLWRAADMANMTDMNATLTSAGATRQNPLTTNGRATDDRATDNRATDNSAKTGAAELPTGCPSLDRLLPDGGWPAADVVELLCDRQGIGELRLLLPALAKLSRQQARWVAWVAPPHIPYAPALAAHGVDVSRMLLIHPRNERDRLWALEQALRSGTCSAVLGWPAQNLRHQDIRRLQLAAVQGNTLCWLFRPEQAAVEASPAPFRLVLRAGAEDSAPASASQPASQSASHLQVKLLKRRGGWATDFIPLALPTGDTLTLQGMQRQLSCWRDSQRSHPLAESATIAAPSVSAATSPRLVIGRRRGVLAPGTAAGAVAAMAPGCAPNRSRRQRIVDPGSGVQSLL